MVDLPESVLVVGYGNPQRSDDGVAWKVLDALRAAHPRPEAPPLRLKRVHQLSPEVAQTVPKAARRIRSLARLWARQPLPEPAGPRSAGRPDGPRPPSP